MKLRDWRQQRRESEYFRRATQRAQSMSEIELVEQVDLAILGANRMLAQYRHSRDPEYQRDQLLEVRINLEACLGMLDLALNS